MNLNRNLLTLMQFFNWKSIYIMYYFSSWMIKELCHIKLIKVTWLQYFLPLHFLFYKYCWQHYYFFLKYNSKFISFLFFSLENRITVSVRELGDLLLSIKGGGQVTLNQPSQRNAVAGEADEVLRPLMDLLDGEF